MEVGSGYDTWLDVEVLGCSDIVPEQRRAMILIRTCDMSRLKVR